jgi:hypothetical protein
VVQHLAAYTDIGDDALESATEDPGPDPTLGVAGADPVEVESGGADSLDEE